MAQPRPVRPVEIVAYLRAAGWEVLDDTYEGAALWGRSFDGIEEEVFVPLRESAPDFGRVLDRMVKTLAVLEKRTPVQVERDMLSMFEGCWVRGLGWRSASAGHPAREGQEAARAARWRRPAASLDRGLRARYAAREPNGQMLESLRLIDFKSFVDETIPFSPVTFLVGVNAAGKSNVLDALRFLHGLSYNLRLAEVLDGEEGRGPDAWMGIRGGAREVARYGTGGFAIHSNWSVAIEANQAHSTLMGKHEIRCDVKPAVRLFEERILGTEGNDILRLHRSAGDQLMLAMPPTETPAGDWDNGKSMLSGGRKNRHALLDPNVRAPVVMRGVGRIQFVEIQPDRMRELSHSEPPLRDDGANLSGVLHTLARDPETRKTFIEWVSELCAPELADLDFIEVEELGDVMVVLVERDGRRITARSMSDGTLRFLGILTALYTAETDSILCFEELGAGLHPARVHLLLELLESAYRERRIQTIVTTHSPSLLRWLPDERLGQAVLLARNPDHPGTIARRLGDLPGFFDAVRTLGLEEMFGTQWLEGAL